MQCSQKFKSDWVEFNFLMKYVLWKNQEKNKTCKHIEVPKLHITKYVNIHVEENY